MNTDNEIQELKNRIASLENQVQNKPRESKVFWFFLIFIIAIVLFLFLIGIYNYISVPN